MHYESKPFCEGVKDLAKEVDMYVHCTSKWGDGVIDLVRTIDVAATRLEAIAMIIATNRTMQQWNVQERVDQLLSSKEKNHEPDKCNYCPDRDECSRCAIRHYAEHMPVSGICAAVD